MHSGGDVPETLGQHGQLGQLNRKAMQLGFCRFLGDHKAGSSVS